jgi:hypothetical protein
MGTAKQHDSAGDGFGASNCQRPPAALPCGARVCLHCHKGCGVAMATYLAGLDETPQPGTEDL